MAGNGAGHSMVQAYGLSSMLIGFIFAAVSAAVSVQWLVGYLNRHSLAIFGLYRVVLAVSVSLLLAGSLMP